MEWVKLLNDGRRKDKHKNKIKIMMKHAMNWKETMTEFFFVLQQDG